MGEGKHLLRYGFVGLGMMGQEHVRNVLALPGAEVVAFADPHEPSIAQALALVDGPARPSTFDDHRRMLDSADLDVVVISTPNHTHHRVLADLWGRPLHLMVEKPLCTTVEDCLEVVERAADHPGLVWMGLEYRYMPAVTRFIEEVQAGAVGDLKMLFIREHRFPFLVKVDNWNRLSRNTGGTLVEKCCHFFDLMNLVAGARPSRVLASGGQDVNHLDEVYDGEGSDLLDNAFVVVDYANGVRACLDLCMFAEGSRWEQELVATGDAGKVEAFVPGFMEVGRGRQPQIVRGTRHDWSVEESDVTDDDRIAVHGAHHGASYLEHVHLCEAIRAGTNPGVTVEDGLWSVAVGAAAHRSIEEGRAVHLSELGLGGDCTLR
ncbi:MAG: Gfo/Idh/MocA family protein [Actinomycetota bacterium]